MLRLYVCNDKGGGGCGLNLYHIQMKMIHVNICSYCLFIVILVIIFQGLKGTIENRNNKKTQQKPKPKPKIHVSV